MGFITPAGGQSDVFVHRSAIMGGATSLVQGQHVMFEPGWDAAKNKAIAIKVSAAGGVAHPAATLGITTPAMRDAALSAAHAGPGMVRAAPPGMHSGTVKVWFE